MLDPAFAAAFSAAKQRIRAMEYHYIEEADQNRQALLEIYCAVVGNGPAAAQAARSLQRN